MKIKGKLLAALAATVVAAMPAVVTTASPASAAVTWTWKNMGYGTGTTRSTYVLCNSPSTDGTKIGYMRLGVTYAVGKDSAPGAPSLARLADSYLDGNTLASNAIQFANYTEQGAHSGNRGPVNSDGSVTVSVSAFTLSNQYGGVAHSSAYVSGEAVEAMVNSADQVRPHITGSGNMDYLKAVYLPEGEWGPAKAMTTTALSGNYKFATQTLMTWHPVLTVYYFISVPNGSGGYTYKYYTCSKYLDGA